MSPHLFQMDSTHQGSRLLRAGHRQNLTVKKTGLGTATNMVANATNIVGLETKTMRERKTSKLFIISRHSVGQVHATNDSRNDQIGKIVYCHHIQ